MTYTIAECTVNKVLILSEKHPVHSRWDVMKQKAVTFVCNSSTQKASCHIYIWINV
jgi:hypothetical protein